MNWTDGFERRFVLVTQDRQILGVVVANIYRPDFINWAKAKALGISAITAGRIDHGRGSSNQCVVGRDTKLGDH